MKKMQMVWAGIAVILAIILTLQAQETAIPVRPVFIQTPTPSSSDDLATMIQALATVVPMPASQLPEETHGFYSAQNPDWPPLPGDVLGLPIWPIGSDMYVLDDANVDYDEVRITYAAALAAQKTKVSLAGGMRAMDAPGVPGDGDGGSGGSGGSFSPMISFSTNNLYLQITNVSNGLAYLNLMNGTDSVYEIYSTVALVNGSNNWTIEQEVWPTNPAVMPFIVPELERTNLFIWARDWTGITSLGNTVPEWWFWKYFGTVDLSDTNLDANDDTLLYDYSNHIAPYLTQTPVLLATISVTDPVDIKWVAPSNLYVLSGSTATLTEFDTNGNAIRALSGLGLNPSGFDVDAAGNVYVALTSSNQVWKFNPTNTTFAADMTFGNGGYIGNGDGSSGTDPGTFNNPFDVAVSADGGTFSVSDSGNNYIQQFDSSGNFITAFGSSGSDVGQFNAPKGLTYDSVGNLYIADSGNSRIVLANDSTVLNASGTSGTAFAQFNSPANISVNDRGIYVADTGNNRIQCFNPLANGVYGFDLSDFRFAFSTNFSGPFSVAAVDNLTNEMFYVADTGNNRVLLYGFAAEDPTPAWTNLTAHVAVGDISGAVSSFSSVSTNEYQQAFVSIGTNDLNSAISQIGTLTPVFIKNDSAEYYFTNAIDGQTITFPVEFLKENGVWKILEF